MKLLYLVFVLVAIKFVFCQEQLVPLRGTAKVTASQSASGEKGEAQSAPKPKQSDGESTDNKAKKADDSKSVNQNSKSTSTQEPSKKTSENEQSAVVLAGSPEPQTESTETQQTVDGTTAESQETTPTTSTVSTTSGSVTPTSSSSSPQVTSETPQASTDADSTSDPNCENSFVMWFLEGIPVTTIYCETYSAIYTVDKSNDPKPKYIKGEVKSVTVTGEKIMVNGVQVSTLSTDSTKPTETSDIRSLSGAELDNVVVYSFTVGGKSISVELPNSDQSAQRTNYTLSSNGHAFYTGSDNKSEYSFNDKGDLVNSEGEVLLKNDPTSSAIKISAFLPTFLFGLILILIN